MLNEVIVKSLNECPLTFTSHKVGKKKVLFSSISDNVVPQIAVGYLRKGETTEIHLHSTLDEYFFIMTGELVFFIDDKEYRCIKGTFIGVPAGLKHSLLSHAEESSFFYFGINTKL